ncbi:MAG TPA: prepilin-type N-terminal cleavage/methylation domain-containing protein [Candidatus Saccharimonadales bacterium]|jgi:Tfp pilus assembly protein PilE
MRRLQGNESGLTIIELSIALTITAILTTIVVGYSVDNLEQSTIQNTKYQLLSNAETGLDTIAGDIRVASAADDNNRYQDPYAPGAPSNELSWASGSSTLILAIAATDQNRDIIFDDAHDYDSAKNNVIYYLSGTTVYRRVLADAVAGNAAVTTCPAAHTTSTCPADGDILDNVKSFSVQYYDNQNQQVTPSNARSIQLSVTLSINKYNQNITTSYTTRMVFRNG